MFLNCLNRKYLDLKLNVINLLPDPKGLFNDIKLSTITYQKKDYEKALKLIKTVDIEKANDMALHIVITVAEKYELWETGKNAIKRLLGMGRLSTDDIHIYTGRLAIMQFLLGEYGDALSNGLYALEKWSLFSSDYAKQLLGICLNIISLEKREGGLETLEKFKLIGKDFRIFLLEAALLLEDEKYEDSVKIIMEALRSEDYLTDEHFLNVHHHLLIVSNSKKYKQEILNKVEGDCYVQVDEIEGYFYIGSSQPLDAEHIVKEDSRFLVLDGKNITDSFDWPGDEYLNSAKPKSISFIGREFDYVQKRGTDAMVKHANRGSKHITAIEIGNNAEDIKESIVNYYSKEKELFSKFAQGQIPLFHCISLLGGIHRTLSKIRSEGKGLILVNDGIVDSINQQKIIAKKVLNGTKVCIDGTSLFMLMECGLVQKILSKIPLFLVPASTLKHYRSIIDQLSNIPEDGSMQMHLIDDDVIFNKISKADSSLFRDSIINGITYIQENADDVFGIPKKEKDKDICEQNIASEVSDACIMAQRDDESVVLTEDITYINFNAGSTGKRRPDNISLWSLARLLLETREINFEEYLNLFYHLSTYRECFLPVTAADLEKCLYKKSNGIVTIHPENIDLFNLNLVWSVEYGTNYESIMNVASLFIKGLILDTSITNDLLVQIFPKIFIPVFKGRDKRKVAETLIKLTDQKARSLFVILKHVDSRINVLKLQMEDHIKGIKIIGG